jgi:hypothetical protein
MALQPVGPLPASTYWRRRLVVGAIVLLVLLLLVKSCGGSSKKESLASATPAPSPRVSAAAVAPVQPSAAASPVPSPTPSPAPLRTCPDSSLQVTTEADATSYPKGSAPRFTLTIRNTSGVACRRALGPGAVELRVFSGEDRIWSSDDCNTSKEQGVLTLPAGQAKATTVQWSGKRTRPGCSLGEVAQPGTYRVSARVGDLIRQGSVFTITG